MLLTLLADLLDLIHNASFANLLDLASGIVTLAAYWRIFEKAGQPGWPALVPVYYDWVRVKICQKGRWLFWALIGTEILMLASSFLSGLGREFLAIYMLSLIAALVFSIAYATMLADAFGKSGGFAAGLMFFTPIFLAILAFGKSEYRGAWDAEEAMSPEVEPLWGRGSSADEASTAGGASSVSEGLSVDERPAEAGKPAEAGRPSGGGDLSVGADLPAGADLPTGADLPQEGSDGRE